MIGVRFISRWAKGKKKEFVCKLNQGKGVLRFIDFDNHNLT